MHERKPWDNSIADINELTPRELEVISLIAEGWTNTSIAEKLVVTDQAIEKHIKNIFWKFGLFPERSKQVHRRVAAVLIYLAKQNNKVVEP
jgi:DNA-binding NarL/FixJ family response regulator